MKTSKIIMGALAGLMATTVSVKALSMKEACEQDPELYWLENTGECLPVHPCQDDELKNDEKYCNRVFSRVQAHAAFDDLAENYVKAYLDNKGMLYEWVVLDGVNYFGQDYVQVKLKNGRIIEFEFDDAGNHTLNGDHIDYPSVGETLTMYSSACRLVFNKTFDGISGHEGYCRNMTKEQADAFEKIFKPRYSGMNVYFDYSNSDLRASYLRH